MTGFESSDGHIQVEVTEESPVVKVLSVTVSRARVDRTFDRTYKNLQKEVRVKGFRPGKAPRSVLERMYAASLPRRSSDSSWPRPCEMRSSSRASSRWWSPTSRPDARSPTNPSSTGPASS